MPPLAPPRRRRSKPGGGAPAWRAPAVALAGLALVVLVARAGLAGAPKPLVAEVADVAVEEEAARARGGAAPEGGAAGVADEEDGGALTAGSAVADEELDAPRALPKAEPSWLDAARGASGGEMYEGAGEGKRGKKETFGNGTVDASTILSQLFVPRSEGWERAHISRLIVNRQRPENKYLANAKHTLEMLPPRDFTKNYSSCAVVGNAGVMLRHEFGAAIDAHSAVFRFNDGPTTGFETHVGSKTTFRVINNNWSRAWLKRAPKGAHQDTLLLFGMGAARSYDQLVRKYPETRVWFMAPEFAGNARGMYKRAYVLMHEAGVLEVKGRNSPPTGVEGIFFAISVCQEVRLYGFGLVADPTVPYHYHDKVKGVEAAHSFSFQGIFLNMLAEGSHVLVCAPHTVDGAIDPECGQKPRP